jgi:hypothetical protein
MLSTAVVVCFLTVKTEFYANHLRKKDSLEDLKTVSNSLSFVSG